MISNNQHNGNTDSLVDARRKPRRMRLLRQTGASGELRPVPISLKARVVEKQKALPSQVMPVPTGDSALALEDRETGLLPSVGSGNTGNHHVQNAIDRVNTSILPSRDQPEMTVTATLPAQSTQTSTSTRADIDKMATGILPLIVLAQPARRAALGTDIARLKGEKAEKEDLNELAMLATRPILAVMNGKLSEIAPPRKEDAPAEAGDVSKTAGNAAVVGFGNIAGNILKYVSSNIMIARGYGADVLGLYSASFALASLVSSIFQLGLDNAMIRYISVYRKKQETNALLGLVIFCTCISAGAGILGALLFLALARYLAVTVYDDPHLVEYLRLMAPLIPLMCIQTIWFSGLQGFKAFQWRVFSERFLPPIVLILLLGIGIFFHFHTLYIIVATLVSTLTGTICGLYFLFRSITRLKNRPSLEQYEMRSWMGFAFPVLLSAIMDIILDATDTLLLLVYKASRLGLAEYSVSSRVSYFVSIPLISLNAIFAPTIAELHTSGERQKLADMFKIVTKWTITFSLPLFLLSALLSRSLLAISGDQLVPGWPVLVALALGQMINAATGSVGYMLIMTGHQRVTFINTSTALVVNIVLGIILTPRYGVLGTAISTGVAEMVVNIVRLTQVVIFLKMQPYRWDTLKPIGAGLISSVITGGLLYLMSHLHPLFHLAVAPVFLASYVILLALFKLSAEDKAILSSLEKKFKRKK